MGVGGGEACRCMLPQHFPLTVSHFLCLTSGSSEIVFYNDLTTFFYQWGFEVVLVLGFLPLYYVSRLRLFGLQSGRQKALRSPLSFIMNS